MHFGDSVELWDVWVLGALDEVFVYLLAELFFECRDEVVQFSEYVFL